jgi:hypothetical protein
MSDVSSLTRLCAISPPRRLAELAGISPSTLVRIEAARWKTAPGHTGTVDRVVAVLEKKGVRFTEMGVELTRKPR